MSISALRTAVCRLSGPSSLKTVRCLSSPLVRSLSGQNTVETVYDNEEGGPKVRGIELLRDPHWNKVLLDNFIIYKLVAKST